MFNHFFKKNFIMTALVMTSFALYGVVQAEEYKATQALPGNASQVAAGLAKTPSGVYAKSSTGGLKDRNSPNNGKVTIASTANSQSNQFGTFIPNQNGQGAAK